jgi:integrase
VSVYKRGDIYHFDFVCKGDRQRGSTGEKTKAKAERYVQAYRESLKLGTPVSRKVHTLREAADKWYAACIEGKKSDVTTAYRVAILFRHINPDLPVIDVGPREIADAIISRRVEPIKQTPKDGEARLPSNSTVNRDIIDTTLRPILHYAEDTLEEPVRRIKWAKLRLKEPRGRVRNFTAEEMAAWRSQLPDWHRPVFDFIARYGVRLDEAFFAPSAVNVEAGEIMLYDTKNGMDHPLQIHEDDMRDLAARKARAMAAGLDTVWFRDEGGELTPIRWRGFQSASRAALDRAGITNARPAHDLRHHAATTLYRATGNIKLVQDLLNHQSIASSARYAHTNKDDLRKALRQTYDTKPPTKDATTPENDVESKGGNGT